MLSQLLLSWFDQHDISPQLVGEFDDSALAYAFCHEGLGLVAAPALIADDLREQFGIYPLGTLDGVRAQFYALSPHKKIKHPAIVAMVNRGRFGP
jgi:LysR family transcriptional activator of nhaA